MISSPGFNTACSTRRPLTLMPFVEPRSDDYPGPVLVTQLGVTP